MSDWQYMNVHHMHSIQHCAAYLISEVHTVSYFFHSLSSFDCSFRPQILCFVDCASRYNRVKRTNSMRNLFLVYFVNLYMFRPCLGPSSGSTIVCIQQFVHIILFRWLPVVVVGLKQFQSINEYFTLYTLSYGRQVKVTSDIDRLGTGGTKY